MPDNPFADLVPKKASGNPFADLVPTTAPATRVDNAFSDLVPSKTQASQGRGIWQAIKDYPGHLLESVTSLPQRAIEGAAQYQPGSGEIPEATIAPAVETAMMTMGTGRGARPLPRANLPPAGVRPNVAPGQPGPVANAPPGPGGPSAPAATGGAVPPAGMPPAPALPTPVPPTAPTGALAAARKAAGTIEKIFSPETVDAQARAAAASIRELSGTAARDTAITAQAIEPAWRKINAMPDADRLNFIEHVEGVRTGPIADPVLQDLATTMREQFEKRMNKIQALPSHAQVSFIEDYFPHFWKEPGAAAQVRPETGGGASKQGSGASLKKRTVPTIADGIAQGLTPLTTNPLEATMRYVTSMDRFIAATDVLETAKGNGTVKFIRPKVMGASGHPDSFKVPPGWQPLEGRGATDATGARAYAPEGWARVYNNYISRGFADIRPEIGDAYEGVRRASNAITGLELSLSGYHFLTVAKAAMDNSMAQAIKQLRTGHPIEAAKQVAKTPLAPVRYAMSGKKVKDVYLGLSQGTRELQNTVDLLTKAGGRASGKAHAPEYEFSKGGSYVTAFKRGALRLQMAADRAEAMGSPLGMVKVGARNIGRIMDTVAAPLFEQYIPAVKNGAFRENLASWLKAHPNATVEEQKAAARQLWDTIDDRFGEMVQDNIFMNKLIKQVGMLSLRSWSWTVGQDIRMLGGAARDVVRAPFKRPTGTGPQDTRWTEKMDMAIAMPIVYGTTAAVYQFLKTGQPPQDIHDLMAPRTGGVDVSTGEPERLMLPGPEKDVFGFYEHPADEALGKRSTMVQAAGQLATNQNWRGDPIFSGNVDNAPPWLQQFWNYASEQFGPISVRNLAKGRKAGSNLNKFEGAMGVRTAPRYLTDPEGYEQMMKSIHGKKWKDKERHERKQQQLYEGD